MHMNINMKYEILARIVLDIGEGYFLDVTGRDITEYSQQILPERSRLFTTKGPTPHTATRNRIALHNNDEHEYGVLYTFSCIFIVIFSYSIVYVLSLYI